MQGNGPSLSLPLQCFPVGFNQVFHAAAKHHHILGDEREHASSNEDVSDDDLGSRQGPLKVERRNAAVLETKNLMRTVGEAQLERAAGGRCASLPLAARRPGAVGLLALLPFERLFFVFLL